MKHITHFTRDFTNFEGYRLSLQRNKTRFVRYFSSLDYPSDEAARDAAINMRDQLLHDLDNASEPIEQIFDKFRKKESDNPFPIALAPAPQLSPTNGIPDCITLRNRPAFHRNLQQLVRDYKLCQTSILRLALYSLFLHCQNTQAQSPAELVKSLEDIRNQSDDLPDWLTFNTETFGNQLPHPLSANNNSQPPHS